MAAAQGSAGFCPHQGAGLQPREATLTPAIASCPCYAEWSAHSNGPYRFWPDLLRRWKGLPRWAKLWLPAISIPLLASVATTNVGMLEIALLPIIIAGGLGSLRAHGNLAFLVPLPLSSEHYPVRLALEYRGVRYAEDDGIVSFVDGWLNFEGEACFFGVRADQMHCLYHRPYPLTQGQDVRALNQNEVRLIDGDFVARLLPYASLPTPDGTVSDLDWKLKGSVHRWAANKVPNGRSILPLKTPLPSTVGWYIARSWIFAMIVVAVGVIFAAHPEPSDADLHFFRLVMGSILCAAAPLAAASQMKKIRETRRHLTPNN